MSFEGSDASAILAALVQFGCVEDPRLHRFVVRRRKDEIASHQNPEFNLTLL
jgi:hypothetical protein